MPNYRKLSDPDAVRKAIAECDRIGRERFLKKYGFGKARDYFLLYEGRQYDSKAIVGAAFGYQFNVPLTFDQFGGGKGKVVPLLEGLGFKVVASEINDNTTKLSEEVPESMWEGGKRCVMVNIYERNAEARLRCIEAQGSTCAICEFNFGNFYGEKFHGFIHVHHKIPLSQVDARYQVDPAEDLVPVCANCHAIIHYGNTTRSVENVRELVSESRSHR